MSNDSGWLISVFGLAIAMASLWLARQARSASQKEAAELRAILARAESMYGSEIKELRQALDTLERGLVGASEALREGRLNLSVRSQALQMLRGGATADSVASSLGIATSEARLLTRVGQVLLIKAESLSGV